MASATLTAETTPEEMQAIVDNIAAERSGEASEKEDAAIVNGHADNEKPEKTPVASGDETAKPSKKGKGEKKAKSEAAASEVAVTEDRSWLDDDLKSEVSAYGIGEDELADFTSREEVQRALRFFDKSALEAGRKALADGESAEQGRDAQGRFTKTETAPEEKTGTGGYEVKLDKSIYDDEIVNEFTRMRDHYESRLEALESRLLAADAQAEERQFDSLIDAMGHTDLFGTTDHEDAKQLERRKDLHVAVKAQMLGLQALGRPTEMSESLVSRVARMVFAEELGKKDLKTRTNRISRQSNSRQGGGATRPSEPRESARDEFDRLYREMSGT